MPFHRLALAAAAFALAGVSTIANAVIVDIDATTNAAVSYTFAAGTYYATVIGTGQGGLYDGWTYKNGSQFREAFSVTIDGNTSSIDTYNGGTKFSSYATTSGAQSAFAAGPYAIYADSTDGNLLYTMDTLQLTLTAPSTTVSFGVPDYYFSDNTGGVSLNVAAAVPEPGTYALLLAGLAAIGFIAARRRPAA